VAPIERAALIVVVLFLVQTAIAILVVALGENTAIEVLHSSVGSLTWLSIATLLALPWTLSPASSAMSQGAAPMSRLRRAAQAPRPAGAERR
jgi:heme A synthase